MKQFVSCPVQLDNLINNSLQKTDMKLKLFPLLILLLTSTTIGIAQQPLYFGGTAEVVATIKSDNFVNHQGVLTNILYNSEINVKGEDLVEHFYYNENGQMIAQRNYTLMGELIDDDFGVAIYEYDFDKNGNCIEIRYFDEEKEMFRTNFIGPALIRMDYDRYNRIIRVRYFLDDVSLIEDETAVIEYEYDEKGYLVEERLFDYDYLPLDYKAPIINYIYDESGKVVEQRFLDTKGNICNRFLEEDEDDFAIIKYVYQGDSTIPVLYDVKGQPVKFDY